MHRNLWILNLWVLLLSVVIAGCGGAEAGDLASPSAETAQSGLGSPKLAVRVEPVTVRTVVDTARLPAELRPRRRAVLAAEAVGVVAAIHAEVGDRVKAGTVLLEIDTRALEQRLREAEAVDRQRLAELERARKLFERRSITEQQRLEAETAREVARVQLEAARLALEKSRIVAPWTGTVAERRAEVGDFVSMGQGIFTLLDLERLEVRAPAPESLVPFLNVGERVEVRVDALAELDAELDAEPVATGTIIRLAAELDPAARTLDVDVLLDRHDDRLRPGMVARMEIPRRTLEDAVLVPLAALVELEDRRVVYVAIESGDGDGTRAEQRTVRLGPTVGEGVVVLEGLAAGERLIVDGHQRVSPGQQVEIETTPATSGS